MAERAVDDREDIGSAFRVDAHGAQRPRDRPARARGDGGRSSADRLSDAITWVAGSSGFVAAHVIFFTAWITLNVGMVASVPVFDPYPFSFLTLVVSLEAIFLSIFVLMSQNRAARLADRRAHLDLQVDLLAERELTAILHMLRALCAKEKVVLDDVGTDVNDLLEETDVTELASDLDEKLPA